MSSYTQELQRIVVLVALRKRWQESNSPSGLRGMKREISSGVWLPMKVPLSRSGMAHLEKGRESVRESTRLSSLSIDLYAVSPSGYKSMVDSVDLSKFYKGYCQL